MLITKTQNAQLHALLGQTKMIGQKANLVLAFTDGRTESSKEMTATEAQQIINYLKSINNKEDAANTMRRKILAMCHRIQWEREGGSVDMVRLNNWCVKSSYLKKELNQYTYQELPKLVSQFRTVYLHYISTTVK